MGRDLKLDQTLWSRLFHTASGRSEPIPDLTVANGTHQKMFSLILDFVLIKPVSDNEQKGNRYDRCFEIL